MQRVVTALLVGILALAGLALAGALFRFVFALLWLLAPLNLLGGLMTWSALTWHDRIAALRMGGGYGNFRQLAVVSINVWS